MLQTRRDHNEKQKNLKLAIAQEENNVKGLTQEILLVTTQIGDCDQQYDKLRQDY